MSDFGFSSVTSSREMVPHNPNSFTQAWVKVPALERTSCLDINQAEIDEEANEEQLEADIGVQGFKAPLQIRRSQNLLKSS